jgi:intracellular sulfur oxidation DsrE/DsrF family protein
MSRGSRSLGSTCRADAVAFVREDIQRRWYDGARFVNEERVMNKNMIAAALAAGVMFGYSGRAWTQTDQKLPVAGYAPAKDIPGARELPNPDVDYKVVFSVAAVAKPEEIHPTLKTIALYLNTLAHNGVPAGHRHLAAVFHQGGGDAVLANDVYKARHNGTINPNIALLHELKQAGVDLRVCGQGLLGKKVDPKDVLPDVQVDLWAMTTMVNLQLRGYVRIGG